MVGLNESHIGFGQISFFVRYPRLSPLGFFGPFHNYKPRGYTRGVTVIVNFVPVEVKKKCAQVEEK